jgi:type I restriction enzyme S subunit
MSTEWKPFRIDDISLGVFDGPHATPPISKDGPIYLGIGNITQDGHLDLSDVRHIAEEDFARWTRRTVPQAGDIVFTYEATLNRYAIIPDGFRGCLGRRTALIRPDTRRVDTRFLFYSFFGQNWRKTIEANRLSGATVDRIPIARFPQFPVMLPSLVTQRRIASILRAYDDLIEVNRRRIALLEEMARRLFEEWFVHFRFPGHEGHAMVETPDGPLPKGWHTRKIGDVCAYLSRGVAPKYDETASSLVVGQKCIRDQHLSLGPARRQSRLVAPEKLVSPGDVLINSTGVGTLGRVAQAEDVPNGLTVDTHVTIVRPRTELDRDFFGLALLRMEPMFERMGAGATGQTELNRGRIADVTLTVPPTDVQSRFGQHARPLRVFSNRLARQNDVLAASRDLVLPRLITGELSVAAAERELEAVA